MTASAVLSPDRATVTLTVKSWSMVMPVAKLAGWIRFYRGLQSRGTKDKTKPGPWARHYAETLSALERVAKEIDR